MSIQRNPQNHHSLKAQRSGFVLRPAVFMPTYPPLPSSQAVVVPSRLSRRPVLHAKDLAKSAMSQWLRLGVGAIESSGRIRTQK